MFCTKCGSIIQEGDEFCANCGAPVKSPSGNRSQQNPANQPEKCPHCGEPLPPFASECPACGYEIRNVSACASISRLSDSINALEQRKIEARNSELGSLKIRQIVRTCDDGIVTLIRTYPIPNTREDALEFAILAASNIDFIGSKKGRGTRQQRAIALAWIAKLRQAYHKSRNMSGSEATYEAIQNLYKESRGPIVLQWISMLPALAKFFLFIFVWGTIATVLGCVSTLCGF
mgnify:CR=1 FL=1